VPPSPSRIAILAALLAAWASGAGAQIPDKFVNLQVLPKDIPRAQLVETMRSFAGALGVRCQHCHVGTDPQDLRTFDFPADTKEPKQVARAMLRMVHEINSKLLPQAGRPQVVTVRCFTCHHGTTKPEALEDVLAAAVEEEGVDAALKKYGELREKHYGRAAYDFGPPPLNTLAERLARENGDAGIAVQEFNVKVNPNVASSYSLLANLYQQKGNIAAARASLEKASALEPGEAFYKRRLQELQASPSPR
jgi:hypothetical protein